jgi:hypothetical protein
MDVLQQRRGIVSDLLKIGLSRKEIAKEASKQCACHISFIYSDIRYFENEDLPMGCRSATGIKMKVFKRDSYKCQYCGHEGDNLVIEHIVPTFHGGKLVPNNLVVACASCNFDLISLEYKSHYDFVVSNAIKDFR